MPLDIFLQLKLTTKKLKKSLKIFSFQLPLKKNPKKNNMSKKDLNKEFQRELNFRALPQNIQNSFQYYWNNEKDIPTEVRGEFDQLQPKKPNDFTEFEKKIPNSIGYIQKHLEDAKKEKKEDETNNNKEEENKIEEDIEINNEDGEINLGIGFGLGFRITNGQ